MPRTLASISPLTFATARPTPLPCQRSPPSRSSVASNSPVEAPDGTAAWPWAPDRSPTSTSTVGFPRLSSTWRAWIRAIPLTGAGYGRGHAALCSPAPATVGVTQRSAHRWRHELTGAIFWSWWWSCSSAWAWSSAAPPAPRRRGSWELCTPCRTESLGPAGPRRSWRRIPFWRATSV